MVFYYSMWLYQEFNKKYITEICTQNVNEICKEKKRGGGSVFIPSSNGTIDLTFVCIKDAVFVVLTFFISISN